ncbi:hypothetical protein SK355_11485 [Candidatus Fukatsuia symbiotica]|uniref:Uncharacterized protein n=1 Tax=Candidatus Fukatsuia symbiotica TaxID=1878942 RepID=A0A2U8I420_9GAMM|nr:hypothetical protein [Candidatus Fukatsuia symbiotica]AWK13868.1 hypothetical protein CCS41_04285 [Candidatus Fukatsuia symbiotica]MEA9445803.1 hypothetical protein [Candidatus Fukatsuia symbiotica]
MKEVPDPRKATLLPAAPLIFTASADQTAAMNQIATAAAQHLLADPLTATKKVHSGETRWEQVFASERAIVDFMARTLIPFFGCITDLAQGKRSAGVIGGCALDIAFALIPLGQFVGSTARIIWRAGEMTLLSLGEAMSDATVKLISGLAQQSTVFALPDMIKGGRWLLTSAWRILLDQVPTLAKLTQASSRLIEEGIILNGSYYRAPQGLTATKFPTTLLGDLEQKRHVLTRSTSEGSVHAVDATNNLPYGPLLSLPGYAGEHATFFYPREIKLVPNVHNGGFITDVALNETARIVDRDSLGIDFGVGSHVYRATPHQSILRDLEHRVSTEAENLESVSCGLRVRRSLGKQCLEKELKSFDDPRELRYQALTHQRYQHGQTGEQTAGLLVLERRIYRYDPAGKQQLALAEENTSLIYKKEVRGRVESEPLFGKPHAFADQVLDKNTYVIKLEGIVDNIADKRTLRALIITDPGKEGAEIIMLEADPLIFYGAKMPNARNLKWYDQVQFVRYREKNTQEKEIIDHYLATIKKEYHPQGENALLPVETGTRCYSVASGTLQCSTQ